MFLISIRQMRAKVICENPGLLQFISNCQKTKICVKKLMIIMLVHSNLSPISKRLKKSVIELREKAVDSCLFMLECVRDFYKTQNICEKPVSERPYMLNYSNERYTIREKSY